MNRENIRLWEGENNAYRSSEDIGGGTRGLAVLLRAMGPLRPDSQLARDSVMIGS